MHGTQRQAEIFHVQVHGLCCTMSTFLSSSTFHCTWHSAQQFTLVKEPFFRRCWWTHVCRGFTVEDIVANILRQQQWRYHCKPHTQNAYLHIVHQNMTYLQLLLTAQLSQQEMTAMFDMWSTTGLVTLVHPPVHICYTSTAPNSATVANQTHVYIQSMTFLTQN